MTQGKKICSQLKAVRRMVAEANDIPLEIKECTHEGDCAGTCPYCEAEVRYLERELQKRKRSGKAAILAGVAMSLSLTGCHSSSQTMQPIDADGGLLEGDVMVERGPEPVGATPRQQHNGNGEEAPDYIETGGIDIPNKREQEPEPLMGKPADPASYPTVNFSSPDTVEILEPLAGLVMMPLVSFPGGDVALEEYLEKHLVYPAEAKKQGIEGTVVVEFFVEADGTISEVHLIKDIGGDCGKEAVRVVKSMPRWNASERTGYTLPIEFKLKKED